LPVRRKQHRPTQEEKDIMIERHTGGFLKLDATRAFLSVPTTMRMLTVNTTVKYYNTGGQHHTFWSITLSKGPKHGFVRVEDYKSIDQEITLSIKSNEYKNDMVIEFSIDSNSTVLVRLPDNKSKGQSEHCKGQEMSSKGQDIKLQSVTPNLFTRASFFLRRKLDQRS